MFANLSWEHLLVLVVVGLVILGPERLPGAMRWTSNALRQAREYLSGMSNQLREDIGPEFDDLRAPLSELQKLRSMTPRAALTKHLLDGDDSIFTGNFDRPGPRLMERRTGPALRLYHNRRRLRLRSPPRAPLPSTPTRRRRHSDSPRCCSVGAG
jgi:sec-independent protein translocase protein TatB